MFGAGCIVELEAVGTIEEGGVEDEGLVDVTERGDREGC